MLFARIEIDDQSAVVIPGILIEHALFHIDVHSANRIDDALEGLDIDEYVMVHRRTEEILDGVLGELVAAVGIGRVDLIEAVPLDLYARIARDREQGGLVLLRIQGSDHQRIRAADIVTAFIDAHDHDSCFIPGDQHIFFLFRIDGFVK